MNLELEKSLPSADNKSLDQDQLISKKMVWSQKGSLEENSDYVISKKMPVDPDLDAKNYILAIENKAQDLFEKNLFNQAESLLRVLHTKSLGSANTYSLLGSCYHQQNRFKLALSAYRKALDFNPDHLETLLNLSLLRFDLGDYEKAEFYYQKAGRVFIHDKEDQWKRDTAHRHLQLGMNYYNKAYYHESLLEFLKAYPALKKSMKLSIDLRIARCLWNLKRKREAFQKLLDLKKLNPYSVDIMLLLGEFYFYAKKITFAISEWERVLKLEPKNSAAVKWLEKTQDVQSVEEGSFG